MNCISVQHKKFILTHKVVLKISKKFLHWRMWKFQGCLHTSSAKSRRSERGLIKCQQSYLLPVYVLRSKRTKESKSRPRQKKYTICITQTSCSRYSVEIADYTHTRRVRGNNKIIRDSTMIFILNRIFFILSSFSPCSTTWHAWFIREGGKIVIWFLSIKKGKGTDTDWYKNLVHILVLPCKYE